jgi:hypothetical protein
MKLTKLLLGLSLVAGLLATSLAAPIYIGDAATEGTALTNGNSQDTAVTVTYAFVNTGGLSANYTAAEDLQIKLTEVNFFKSTSTGSLTPFVAVYSGDLTNASVNTGANYTVLAIGDTFNFGSDAVSSLRNLAFTVNGVNPTISLSSGQTLVAGFLNSGTAGVVRLASTTAGNAIDYTALANTLPGTVPNPLTANAALTLNRTLKYNVGFEVVPIPEPGTFVSLAAGAAFLYVLRRRRRSNLS